MPDWKTIRTTVHERVRWLVKEAHTEPSEIGMALLLGSSVLVMLAACHGVDVVSMRYLVHVLPAELWLAIVAVIAGLQWTGILLDIRNARIIALAFECMYWPARAAASLGVGPTYEGALWMFLFWAACMHGLYRLVKRTSLESP